MTVVLDDRKVVAAVFFPNSCPSPTDPRLDPYGW
jgi:hypothetical protein